MINKLTLGEVLTFIAFVSTFIGSFKVIKDTVIKTIDKTLKPLNDKIDDLELSSIRTDLVNFMAEAEKKEVSHEQVTNAYELFDRYHELGGNSYIHDKWDKLKKEGKI